MNINKRSLFTIGIILLPTYLFAMQKEEEEVIKKPQSQQIKFGIINTQELSSREEDRNNNCCNPVSFLKNVFPYWNNITGFWDKLQKCLRNKAEEQVSNISLLPNETLWHIGNFLDSMSILRFSSSNRDLRYVFNESFWLGYMAKVPKAQSQLVLRKSLSPSKNKKEFFAHLWYCEGRISLAARLNHPEAVILRDYSTYGAWVNKDQYFCPSGFIRHISGVIDYEKTDKLREAERKKVSADKEKSERLKKRQEVIYSKRFLN